MKCTYWVTFVACLACTTGAFAAGVKAGWIDGLIPPEDDGESVKIVRDGQVIAYSRTNRLLYEGDQVSLDKNNVILKLYIGESGVSLTSAQARPAAPYVVKLSGEVPSVQKNLFDWIGEKLRREDPKGRLAKTIPANVRAIAFSPSPMIPALDEANPRLVGGVRDISLIWRGGTPPYRLVLVQDGDETVADQLAGYAYRFPSVRLTEGTLQVVLEDSKMQHFESNIQVVPEADRPKVPQVLNDAHLDSATRNRLYADWLLTQDDGWGFEAFQWK